MATRRCDQCGSAIPDRMARERDDDGRLVCKECKRMTKAWPTHSAMNPSQTAEFRRRAAQALRSILRTDSLSKQAHDSGDNAILNHCPFCGSGSITGGSDGSVDCDYCHTVFTVQVQPAHPNMPQTIDGQPTPPPGMPAGQETEMSAPVDPAVDQDANGDPSDPLGDAKADPTEQAGGHDPSADQDVDKGDKPNPFARKDGPPSADDPAKKKNPVPPQFQKGSRFFTSDGDVLTRDSYAKRLALAFSDDRMATLGSIRGGADS